MDKKAIEDEDESTSDTNKNDPRTAEPKKSRKYSSTLNNEYNKFEELTRDSSISDMKAAGIDDADTKSSSPPTIRSLQSTMGGGYNQTYLIMKKKNEQDIRTHREVFFRCGQWCYKGDVEFFDIPVSTADLPTLIPTLQRQQSKMKYFCGAATVPSNSDYYDPLQFINEGIEFIATEIVSEKVEKELKRWSKIFRWIEEDTAKSYFELICEPPISVTSHVELIANKTYNHGLIIISIFYKSSIYFVLQDGEGDQPLLDVRFPNVSRHGQGLLVANYFEMLDKWKKITLWHNIDVQTNRSIAAIRNPSTNSESKTEDHTSRKEVTVSTVSVSSREYMQTYCILKSQSEQSNDKKASSEHEVLFRFGNWCYAGTIQLIPCMSIADIPFVIPALRMQQSKLTFLCDAAHIPTNNTFVRCLQYMQSISPYIDHQIVASEDTLVTLIEKLTSMGVGESVSKWLQSDSVNSFFEFKVSQDDKLHTDLKDVEVMASKSYRPGIVTITVIFQQSIYVSVQEVKDDNPLLDSKFPDVSGKGRGYQLQSYDKGIEGWPALQKVSVWQTASALEEEFKERTAMLVQNAAKEENVATARVEANEGKGPAQDKESGMQMNLASSDNDLAETKESKLTEPSTEKICVESEEKSEKHPAFISGLSASEVLRTAGSGFSVSRPHHLPKLDTLSKKVEDMRRALENNNDATTAPWDDRGQPLFAKIKLKK